MSDAADQSRLRRSVGLLDLSAIGIGAIIGTGIFVIVGEAIGRSGPSIVLAFVLAAVTCAFSALSFAELASAIPVSGSSYTYAYATLGELAAWVIGWDLILEYAVSVSAVAVGWGHYFNELLHSTVGVTLPASLVNAPGEGGIVNLPAILVVLAVTALLITGVRESTRANTVMVFVKVGILLLFVVLAATAFNADHLSPFFTDGFHGVTSAASLIFFSYIGFDAISTSAEEARRPQRDLPLAILISLAIATALYCLVAIAASGALPFGELKGAKAPLALVLERGAGISWGATVLSAGALVAITSVVLTVMYGQTRIMYAMSRDGLVPPVLSHLSRRTATPVVNTAIFGFGIAVLAAVIPLARIADLVNIGTLFAFVVVNIGVMVLRVTKPNLHRGFRVPILWFCAPLGVGLCIYLMAQMTASIWIGFAIWTTTGLCIYALYGRRRSKLRLSARS